MCEEKRSAATDTALEHPILGDDLKKSESLEENTPEGMDAKSHRNRFVWEAGDFTVISPDKAAAYIAEHMAKQAARGNGEHKSDGEEH